MQLQFQLMRYEMRMWTAHYHLSNCHENCMKKKREKKLQLFIWKIFNINKYKYSIIISMWKFKTSILNRNNKKLRELHARTYMYIYCWYSHVNMQFLIYYYYFLLICWIIEGCYSELWVIEDQCKHIRICNCLQRFLFIVIFILICIHCRSFKNKAIIFDEILHWKWARGCITCGHWNMTWSNNSMTIEMPKIANNITQSIIRR